MHYRTVPFLTEFISCYFTLLALPLTSSLDLLATQDPNAEEDEDEETPLYEKFDPLLHQERGKSKK